VGGWGGGSGGVLRERRTQEKSDVIIGRESNTRTHMHTRTHKHTHTRTHTLSLTHTHTSVTLECSPTHEFQQINGAQTAWCARTQAHKHLVYSHRRQERSQAWLHVSHMNESCCIYRIVMSHRNDSWHLLCLNFVTQGGGGMGWIWSVGSIKL